MALAASSLIMMIPNLKLSYCSLVCSIYCYTIVIKWISDMHGSSPPTPPSSQPQLQENRGVVNPKTGENVQPAGTGGYSPLTGDYYLPSGSGYFNPKTG